MKTLMRSLLFAVITILVMLPGCGKNDDKVLNKMTIAGNENTEYEFNIDYTPLEALFDAVEWKCGNPIGGYIIQINFSPSAVMVINLYALESGSTVIPGNFDIGSFCDQDGAEAGFEFSSGGKAMELWMLSGTVNISKKRDTYDIDVDLAIHPDAGGGTLKGNFHGGLTETVFE